MIRKMASPFSGCKVSQYWRTRALVAASSSAWRFRLFSRLIAWLSFGP